MNLSHIIKYFSFIVIKSYPAVYQAADLVFRDKRHDIEGNLFTLNEPPATWKNAANDKCYV